MLFTLSFNPLLNPNPPFTENFHFESLNFMQR